MLAFRKSNQTRSPSQNPIPPVVAHSTQREMFWLSAPRTLWNNSFCAATSPQEHTKYQVLCAVCAGVLPTGTWPKAQIPRECSPPQRVGETRVRFFGIDAPEIKQKCVFNDKTWNCGIEARIALVKMIAEQEVSCEKKDKDRYGRIIAVCTVGGVNLNALMVRGGWALAYRKYSRDYVDEELIAKDGKRGLWKGTFKRPWEWRRSKRSSNRN